MGTDHLSCLGLKSVSWREYLIFLENDDLGHPFQLKSHSVSVNLKGDLEQWFLEGEM